MRFGDSAAQPNQLLFEVGCGVVAEGVDVHAAILEAISNREAEVAAVRMRTHLERASEEIVAALTQQAVEV